MLQLDHIRLQRPYRLFCRQIIQAPYREAGGHVQKYRCILKPPELPGKGNRSTSRFLLAVD